MITNNDNLTMSNQKSNSSKTVQMISAKASDLTDKEKQSSHIEVTFKSSESVFVAENLVYHENQNPVKHDTFPQKEKKWFEDYLKQFNLWLKQEVKKRCNDFDRGAGIKKLNLQRNLDCKVPLQFSTKVQHCQSEIIAEKNVFIRFDKMYSFRDDFLFGNIRPENFFTKAKRFATKLANQKTFTFNEAREDYINRVGNIVGILGGAGMGKTTLFKQLLEQTLSETTNLYNAEFVFCLQFRNLNYTKKTSFLNFLAPGSIPSRFVENKATMNKLLDELNENENVCVIMDGFDEADLSTDFARPTKIDIHDDAYAEDFIQNLLQGNILPKAKKLLSSRPGQLFEIHEESRPKFLVNILGLDKHAQKYICEKLCGSKAEQVFSIIQENLDFVDICCAPFNCIMVCHCIKGILERNENEQTSNQTNILANTLTFVLTIVNFRFMKSDHIREKLEPSKLATLAWRGLQQNKLRFDTNDLLDVDLENVNTNAYLITICGEYELPLLEGLETKYTYFSHKILQEFYAALKLLLFTSVDDFVQLFSMDIDQPSISIFSSQYENVIKFLCGLCNKRMFEYLKQSVSPCTYPLVTLKILQEILLCETISLFCSDLLKVFNFVYEMQDNDFSEKIAEKLNRHISISGWLSRKDVIALSYVLQFRKTFLSLDIDMTLDPNNDWIIFAEKMVFLISTAPIIITNLCFRPDSFSLKLFREINEKSFLVLRRLVQDNRKPLHLFNPIYRELEYFERKLLSECLFNIEELNFEIFYPQIVDVNFLCEAVHSLHKPLKKLNLSNNSIGNEGATALSNCLHNIEELILSNCEICNDGISSLTKAIASLRSPMKKLDVSYNEFNDSALCLFTTECLENIENLSVMHNDFNSVASDCFSFLSNSLCSKVKSSHTNGSKHLFNEIKKLSKPLNELQASLMIDGSELFSTHNICNIRNLYLHRDHLNEEENIGLSNVIKNLSQPLNRLALVAHVEKTDEQGFKGNKKKDAVEENKHFALFDCLHNINEIILVNNRLTPTAMENIVDEIKKRSTPLKCLELYCCFDTCISENKNLCNKPLDVTQPNVYVANTWLFKSIDILNICLSNIEELVLFGYHLNNEIVESLSTSIRQLEKPIKVLDMEDENLDCSSLTIMCSSLSNIEKLYFCSLGFSSQFDLSSCNEALLDAVHELTKPMELLYIEDGKHWKKFSLAAVRKLNKYQNKIKTLIYNKQVVFSSEEFDINASKKTRSDVIVETIPSIQKHFPSKFHCIE